MWRPQGRACAPRPEPRPCPAGRRDCRHCPRSPNGEDRGQPRARVPSRLPARSVVCIDRPVTLPPGRARLATMPLPTGSAAAANTIGITDVACFAAMTAGVVCVTMTSTLSRTNSATISAKGSARPSAQRYSMVTVRPSIQPSSCSLLMNAEVQWRWLSALFAPRNSDHRRPILLRARHERPRRRASQSSDQRASVHSMTSSASASSLSGIWRPSVLAVLRLTTNSNLVGRTIGNSAGFSPFRMRPV